MLFIRMLVIQELAMPLYEKFTLKPTLVTEIEEDLVSDKKHTLDGIIKEMRLAKSLSVQQEKFLRNFMYEKPRFYEEGKGMIPHSIEPFIFLASSSEFSDVRGPTAEDFLDFVTNQNTESISAALKNAGEVKMNDIIEKLQVQLDKQRTEDIPIFVRSVQSLTNALSIIDNASPVQLQFVIFFSSLDFSNIYNNSQPVKTRVDIAVSLSKWLDTLPESTEFGDFISKLSIQNQNEIDQIEPFIKEVTTLGQFSSKLACSWLVYHYQSNQDKALVTVDSIQEKLNGDALQKFLELGESLATEFAKQPETDKGNKIWRLIKKLNNNELNTLVVQKLSEHIFAGRQNVIKWIAENFDDVAAIGGKEAIQNASIMLVKPHLRDHSTFVSQISNNSSLMNKFIPDLWNEILTLDDAALFEILKLINSNAELEFLSPSVDQANLIANRLIQYSRQAEDENRESEILIILKRTNLWTSWSELPPQVKKQLIPKTRKNVNRALVKQAVEQIFESWKK